MKRILLICLSVVSTLTVLAQNDRPVVTIQTTMGEIVVELFNETPLHRDNFLRLVDEHVYDSLLFHRVIPGFMIQAGDTKSKNAPSGVLLGDSDLPYQVPTEIRVDQGIVHHRGVLAAARESDDTNPTRASSSTQFYITQTDVHRLDGKYTVFGRVIRGMEVVDAIAAVPTDRNDRPLSDIRILSTSYSWSFAWGGT